MSEYFPKLTSLEKVKVKLDLSNYATKTDLKKVIGIDTSPVSCMSQRRRRYVSNETPNDASVKCRQDVSVVCLQDVLLVCRDHVSKGRNDDTSPRRLK